MRDHVEVSQLRWLGAALAALLAIVALPSPAGAQQDDVEQAKKYYKRGMQAFYEDDYPMAITNFKRAHSISPSGTLLFNISAAYSKLAKPEDALEFARKAAEFDDLPKDTRVKNSARMTGYRVAIRVREATGAPRATGGGSGSGSGGNSGGSDMTTLRWVGVSVGVAGVGLLAGAGAVGANVSSNIDAKTAAEQRGDLAEADELYQTIQSQQTIGQILLYSGIAAIAGGTTLFILDSTSTSSEGQALDVTGGPTADGFRVGVDVPF